MLEPDGDIIPGKPAPQKTHDHTPFFPHILGILAVVLLAIAAGSQFSQYQQVSRSLRELVFSICPTQCGVQPDVTMTPALKAVLDTVQARQSLLLGGHRHHDFVRKANRGQIAAQVTSVHGGLFAGRNNDAGIALDDVADAKRCWTMPPLPSQLGIRISHLILPLYVSIEHLSEDTAVERAPQNMTLWGVIDGRVNTQLYNNLAAAPPQAAHDRLSPSIAKDLLWAPLTSFVYDIHGGHSVQTFPISPCYADTGITFGVFALEVHTNWGHSSTCLYKVGIHGTLPP